MKLVDKTDLKINLQKSTELYNYDVYDSASDSMMELYKKEINDFESKYPISKVLKELPHLKLDVPNFDYTTAKIEIENAIGTNYMQMDMRNSKEQKTVGSLHHPHWKMRSIINYTPHSDKFLQKQSKESATWEYPEYQPNASKKIDKVDRLTCEDMEYYKTDLYSKLPTVTDYLFTHLCESSYRVHVMQIGANGYLNWHNHARLPWDRQISLNDKAIVHIPIYTHPNINMLVKKDKHIYAEHYKEGSVYVFNQIYDHAVENNSDIDRIHVVAFIPLTDKKFTKVVEKSL